MTIVTLTITETRPNLNVLFYQVPRDFITYIQRYNDIRHREVYGWTTSGDLLSRSSISTFNTQGDLDTFINDPEVIKHQTANDAYNNTNGIVKNRTVS